MITPTSQNPVRILLADDDDDDRYLFNKELKAIGFKIELTTVEDGQELMAYLAENVKSLPDILFLDHNMPRKNGAECLQEIMQHPQLKLLPVIMYSTYVHEDIADLYFKTGAHFYIRKTGQKELRKLLHHLLTLFVDEKFSRPTRAGFVLSATDV